MKWIIILFIILFVLAFIGITALIIYVIRKSTKPKSQEFIANEQKTMRTKVAQMKAELSPWSDYSFQDLTTAMKFKYKIGATNTLTGKIYAQNKQPIVAFDRMERGIAANGYMFASSSDFDIYYDIRVNEFKILFNNELLGNINKAGVITNNTGQAIGHAKHPVKVSGNLAFVSMRAGSNTFPLQMNNRHLATINVAPNYSNSNSSTIGLIFNENNWGQPVIALHETPTPEEEKWLISLAILETGFHGHWLI